MDLFSTREIATIVWSLIALFFILKNKETRKCIINIVEILFSKNILIPFIVILGYSGLLLLMTLKLRIYEYLDLKDIIIWVLFAGVPLCYGASNKVLDKNYFREIVKENIKFIILIEFIIDTFTFPIIAEMLIIPVFTFLIIFELVSGTKKEYEKANRVISYILSTLGFFIFYKSFSLGIKNYRELDSIGSLVSIVTPIILSILYIPIIFLFGICFNYNNIFFRLKTMLKFKLEALKNNIKERKRGKYNYKVENIDDISMAATKRKSITLILKERYSLKNIENICMEQFSRYNYKNDVVWIYVATNKENYIISNWIVQAQWINPKLDDKSRPISLGGVTRGDMYFKYNESYYQLEEYYRRNIFEDDKYLLINNLKLYDKVSAIYGIILKYLKENDYNKFFEICDKYRKEIRDIYFLYGNIGISTNIGFENYLQEFQNYIALIDNMMLYVLDKSRDFKNKEYLIKTNMKDLDNIVSKIEDGRFYWMNKLGITLEEYEQSEFKEENTGGLTLQ